MELYTLGRGIYSAHSCACSGLPVLSYLRPRPCHHSLLWVADPLPAKERERKVAPCLFWECCVRRRLHKACAIYADDGSNVGFAGGLGWSFFLPFSG